MNTRTFGFSIGAVALATGCGATQPIGAEGHEQAARAADSAAAIQQSKFDPSARETRCVQQLGRASEGVPCWTSDVNPTQKYRARAEQLRAAAAGHRAASRALRDAEAAACASVAPEDRDASPLQHDGDTLGVEEVQGSGGLTSLWMKRLVGARVMVRSVPGLTAERLQTLVDCHVARNASMGYQMPEMESCPLALRGVKAVVENPGIGFFVVRITSDESATAAEILKRSRSLLRP